MKSNNATARAAAESDEPLFLKHSSQRMLQVVNNMSTELSKYNLNLDVAYPVSGIIVFAPGFLLGLARG